MPEISRFFGIVIAMYYRDHAPPHFHASYGGDSARFSIETLELLEGSLPRRVVSLVVEWAFAHRDELSKDWELARERKPLFDITPLDKE